jgi:hypothetical protein
MSKAEIENAHGYRNGENKIRYKDCQGSSIVIRRVASTYVWNATYHSSLLVVCAHVLHATHHINGQIT